MGHKHIHTHTHTCTCTHNNSDCINIPCSLLVSSLAAAEKGSKGDGSAVPADEELPCPSVGVVPEGPGGAVLSADLAPPTTTELELESMSFGSPPGGTV